MVGLQLYNCTILSMKYSEYEQLTLKFMGIAGQHKLLESLVERNIFTINDPQLIILEIVNKKGERDIPLELLLEMLKLYKAEDIFSCYGLHYACKDGIVSRIGHTRMIRLEHAICYCPSRYSLTEEEKDKFSKWFDQYFLEVYGSGKNKKFRDMRHTYEMSYLIGVAELEFIMLFSVLEMIMGRGNSEITYQISRGTALLLSDSKEQMKEIYREMKRLYNSRSKYVHAGEDVSWENVFKLREIVRKVLMKLIELGYHKEGTSFDQLQDDIMVGGYQE